MAIEISIGYPPDRESPIAEFCIHGDGGVELPAIIYKENGELFIEMFSRAGTSEWKWSLPDLEQAIEKSRNYFQNSN